MIHLVLLVRLMLLDGFDLISGSEEQTQLSLVALS